jgi:mono/diheme cytochrome c family protein
MLVVAHRTLSLIFGCVGLCVLLVLPSCGGDREKEDGAANGASLPDSLLPEQTPGWSDADREFFLYGSMGTEVVPEAVLRAWTETEPGLFSTFTLENFGAVRERADGPPIGFSRRHVEHLGGLPSIGINCASCHSSRIEAPGGGKAVTVLGTSAPFDAEAFFGAVVVAMLKTADPEGMKKFLPAYVRARMWGNEDEHIMLARIQEARERVEKDAAAIAAVVMEDPFANRGAAAGTLHRIAPEDVDPFRPDTGELRPLPDVARGLLRLFHNMRAALHIPDTLPSAGPPPSGPGRNDAFGLLSLVLLGRPAEYAPVKFGLVWNLDRRRWVHWDGNTPSPIARNVLAAVGLGAPLQGKKAIVDGALLKRQTALSETIRPPRYPWEVDEGAAKRGAEVYAANCARCHEGPEADSRLYAIDEVGTDPTRAKAFTREQADAFNGFLRAVEVPSLDLSKEAPIRGTGKYWAADLAGVWARGPFLHNGSVRTIADLLEPPAKRPKSWRRGTREYDAAGLGPADGGVYVFDATAPGNSNSGHDYGTGLDAAAKKDLIEYLKAK